MNEGSIDVAVIGGGPAGLRAAEVAAAAGKRVVVFDGKPSVGRKFLVAGKGGLNLTHGEDFGAFVERYAGGDFWPDLLGDFDPRALRDWCEGLGIETFEAGSGRVYPKVLKGAPLLRRWVDRLKSLGVRFEMKRLWVSLERSGDGWLLGFGDGLQTKSATVVFSMGGGSWPRTGSDGSWVSRFQEMGIACAPLKASNCGWECEWPPDLLAVAEGRPLKNLRVTAGERVVFGELLVTRYGLEGGAIYALGRELRGMPDPVIEIDFKPTFSVGELERKMAGWKGGMIEGARKLWKLSDAAAAVVGRKNFSSAGELAREVKACEVRFSGLRPIAEAISSAGGVCWSEVDANLMLRKFPGVYVAGEMLDWDAPTGGYLMQGCFATGTRAGKAVGGQPD